MLTQDYWNDVGARKDFEDPIFFDKLNQFLTPTSRIVEYGCGYGRVMDMFKSKEHANLVGFDLSQAMIQRGNKENPDLDLRLLQESSVIPIETESVDVVMMSTVLCCMVSLEEKKNLMDEIHRVLVSNGVVYITDFLLCDHSKYKEKYTQGLRDFGRWGTYQTSEGLMVCHYAPNEILALLKAFNIQWFEQFDFKTMNQNPARTFHCIAKKDPKNLSAAVFKS